jgi:hypothetical protein
MVIPHSRKTNNWLIVIPHSSGPSAVTEFLYLQFQVSGFEPTSTEEARVRLSKERTYLISWNNKNSVLARNPSYLL